MNILIDNFVSLPGVKNSWVNEPREPFGVVENKSYCQDLNIDLAITNTGVIYFRYTTSTEDSPYGWMELQKLFNFKSLNISGGFKKIDFETEYRYITGMHFVTLKSFTNDKYFKVFDNKRKKDSFDKEVLCYKTNILNLFETVNKDNHYRIMLKTLKSEL